MRVSILSCALLVTVASFSGNGFAQDKPIRVAIMNIQAAIAQCNEGQDAAKVLRDKFAPKRNDLEKMQREINDLQNQLKNQEKTLTEDAKAKLLRSIDDKTRAFNRSNEDATTEFQQAEQDAINEIGRKMLAVINDHAQKSGYTVVLDVSSPQTPVLYADPTTDVTQKIIELFNESSKAKSSSTPTDPASKPAAAAPAAKPPAAATPAPAKPATAPKATP
jgi:outer membrane protein